MIDSENQSTRKKGREKKPGVRKERERDRGEGIEKGSQRKEKTKEKEVEETDEKRVQDRKGERRPSEADVLGSFRAMSRLGVQTSHGQHTKHWTQCPDPDSCY